MVIVAIGLALASAVNAQGADRHGRGNAATQQAQNAPKGAVPPPKISPTEDVLRRIAGTLEAQETKSNSPEERERERRNLKAQEDMARWAKWMIGVGGAELILTFAGVVLVFRNLRETRRIGEAQVRAYLNVKNAKLSFYGLHGIPRLTIEVANTGQSQGANIRWRPRIKAYFGSGMPVQDINHPINWMQRSGIDVSANSAVALPDVIFPQLPFCDYAERFSRVGYRDVPRSVLLQVHIEFRWKDVFNNELADEVFFAGEVTEIIDSADLAPFERWTGDLAIAAQPPDWGN